LSTEPVAPFSSRLQLLFPFAEPIRVQPPDELSVELSTPDGRAWVLKWSVRASDGRVTSGVHTSSYGGVASPYADVEPRRRAVLRAALTVLETLSTQPQTAPQLTERLLSTHGDLFATHRAAQNFVADLLERFADPAGSW
jgi:hypothetical protein